jgi:hypothetical protein
MNIRNFIFGTLSYIVASFLVQAISHFAINADHYASISFMREEPLMYFGLITMLLQGIILTTIYLKWANGNFTVKQGLFFSWLIGVFFVTYPALVEADKYNVENIMQWVMVEGSAGAVQFTLFGLLLGKFVKTSNE